MKNVLLLDNYYLPDDLKAEIETYVEYYHYERFHESLDNVTPADLCSGTAAKILDARQRIKERTSKPRKRYYNKAIAKAIAAAQILIRYVYIGLKRTAPK